MSAVKKRRKPANDHRPLSSERMSYVVLTRPRRKLGRIAVAGMIVGGGFVLSLAGLSVGFDRKNTPLAISVAPVASLATPVATAPNPAPYDIMINASDVAPPTGDEVSAIADILPAQAIAERPAPHQAVVSLDIQESGDKAESTVSDAKDEAGFEAEEAQKLAQTGDARKALAFQHRAAELAPDNMLYRLQLAVLFDQVGDGKDAAMLYRQVVDAYDSQDATLPRMLGIEGIRRRAEYLTASIEQP